jgi:SAM-dependent methyltransferase
MTREQQPPGAGTPAETVTSRAFEEYGRRSDRLDTDASAKLRWFDALVETTYLQWLPAAPASRILEIGCNRGYLLHALKKRGFERLEGVDLASGEIDLARELTGIEELHAGDAGELLRRRGGVYDAILFKAVLEHVPREDLADFLGAVGAALAPGGVVLCEVPNMDWYAASHERFMDVTHETGYTPESLYQLFALYFRDVEVTPVIDPAHGPLASARRRLARRLVFGLVRRTLRLLGEDAAEFAFDSRSILAVARAPRSS